MRKLALLLVLAAPTWGHTLAIHTLNVTIGASVTQVSATAILTHQVDFQNNATHAMAVGDSSASVSSARGAQLASGTPGGSYTVGPMAPPTTVDLSSFYVAGTQNDILQVTYVD